MLVHMLRVCLFFVRNHQIVFQGGLHHFAFLPAMNDSFYCSTSLLVFGIICVLDLGHYNQRRAFALW